MNIFLTATGTNVGKTYVAQALLSWDCQQNHRLLVSKPVLTGWPKDQKEIQQTDTGRIITAQNLPLTPHEINRVSPWRFLQPLTPSMAAAAENKELVFSELINYCLEREEVAQQDKKISLIEGVGGVMAPLTEQHTVLDWARALACPCILVAGSYLGTLSHTLTAVKVLQAAEVVILAIVVSETDNSTVPLSQTVTCLKSFLPMINILGLPYLPSFADNKAISSLYSLILRSYDEKINIS